MSLNQDFWDIVRKGLGNEFTDNVKGSFEAGNWNEVIRVYERNKKYMLINALRNMGFVQWLSFIKFFYANFRRTISPNGLFIAFVGPDGCGKTTVQSNLAPFFEKGFTKNKIAQFYWRPFLLPRIRSLMPSNGNKIQNINPDERLEHHRSKAKSLAKLVYYWIDYIIGEVKYHSVRAKGGVVCFDRYWDDMLIFPQRFGLSVSSKIVSLLGIFVPKPDLVFYLHANADILVSRKQELPIDETLRQVKEYKRLALARKNHVLIDGTQSKDEVLKSVIRACLEFMTTKCQEVKFGKTY